MLEASQPYLHTNQILYRNLHFIFYIEFPGSFFFFAASKSETCTITTLCMQRIEFKTALPMSLVVLYGYG